MSRKKILVVDDAEFNRDLIVQLLEDEYDILTAVNGVEGVHTTEQERPDLVLMDLGMRITADQTVLDFHSIPPIQNSSRAVVQHASNVS